ncbi:hypothetical protein ACSDR0_50810 [Streptosporangium sp. G11]|uniref:hypothetical protein n=1 Tax=Streptosporangium sp. G11 TaxID=3436926 RepID=UPI003EB69ED7
MHTLIRKAGTALAGVVLAGTGMLVALPATSAHAESFTVAAAKAAPETACTQAAGRWICYLLYCRNGICYYRCYPVGYAGDRSNAPTRDYTVEGTEADAARQIEVDLPD